MTMTMMMMIVGPARDDGCEAVVEVRTRKFRGMIGFLVARWGTTFWTLQCWPGSVHTVRFPFTVRSVRHESVPVSGSRFGSHPS